jgi:hypothetical protein
VKNDGSGMSPNTFEPLSLSKAVLKAAAREVSNGVKDGPILSQARSRSKGPLSDQVADATKPRDQCRGWVDLTHSPKCIRTAARRRNAADEAGTLGQPPSEVAAATVVRVGFILVPIARLGSVASNGLFTQ